MKSVWISLVKFLERIFHWALHIFSIQNKVSEYSHGHFVIQDFRADLVVSLVLLSSQYYNSLKKVNESIHQSLMNLGD